MTEADTESIWNTTLDTTRFGNIGVRIAEILNFWVNGDATSQVTNTAVTPILEQISEECLMKLISAAKEARVTEPWMFVSANVSRIASRVIFENRVLLDRIRKILGDQKMESVRRTLPSSTSSW